MAVRDILMKTLSAPLIPLAAVRISFNVLGTYDLLAAVTICLRTTSTTPATDTSVNDELISAPGLIVHELLNHESQYIVW